MQQMMSMTLDDYGYPEDDISRSSVKYQQKHQKKTKEKKTKGTNTSSINDEGCDDETDIASSTVVGGTINSAMPLTKKNVIESDKDNQGRKTSPSSSSKLKDFFSNLTKK